MKKIIVSILTVLCCVSGFAQAERHSVRAGNRKFRRSEFKEAEIDYRKALLKDSLSFKANYNLASALYRQEDYEAAAKALSAVQGEEAPAQSYFNSGDIALQRKDYAAAVNDFREALLRDPADLDAKQNYIYARKMLENRQDQGGDDNEDNPDNRNNQDQDNKDNGDNGGNDQDQGSQDENGQQPESDPQPQEGRISRQQAQQVLNAIQAKEKETQDKVNKEKAALLKSKQKEKNW